MARIVTLRAVGLTPVFKAALMPGMLRSFFSIRFAACLGAALLAVTPAFAAAKRPTVIVLPFDNDTGKADYEPLGKGLADMMITSLANVPSIQVLEREKLDALLHELKLQRSKYFDPKTAQAIGKGVGAQYLVAGSFSALEPTVQINVRVVKVASSEVVAAQKISGNKAQLFELQNALSDKLASGLASVLSGDDAQKIKEATVANRVDDLKALLDYARGLDLRDKGDYQNASKALQQAMQSAPDFSLARSRYMQVMRDLYAAKKTREEALSDNEQILQRSIEDVLGPDPKQVHGRACKDLAYRILRGQLILKRVGDKLDAPAADYMPLVEAYRLNQVQVAETGAGSNLECEVSAKDKELAKQLGISDGGEYSFFSAHLVMRDLAGFLVFGKPPFFGDLRLKKDVCFFKANPKLLADSTQLLDRALKDIEEHEKNFKERETIRALQLYADIYLQAGKPEDAIAKLQTVLNRYPKSEEFAATEEKIREILEGKARGRNCETPR